MKSINRSRAYLRTYLLGTEVYEQSVTKGKNNLLFGSIKFCVLVNEKTNTSKIFIDFEKKNSIRKLHVVNVPELCKYHSNELFWPTSVEDAYHLKYA